MRPLATHWAAAAGSAQLAKRDAASLRRAHQQAASSRAPAVSTHATPTLPSETSSAHLVVYCGRCDACITAVSGVRRAGSREWRIDHEDMCVCLLSDKPEPTQNAPSSALPSGDAGSSDAAG